MIPVLFAPPKSTALTAAAEGERADPPARGGRLLPDGPEIPRPLSFETALGRAGGTPIARGDDEKLLLAPPMGDEDRTGPGEECDRSRNAWRPSKPSWERSSSAASKLPRPVMPGRWSAADATLLFTGEWTPLCRDVFRPYRSVETPPSNDDVGVNVAVWAVLLDVDEFFVWPGCC